MFRTYPLYRDVEMALNKALQYGSGTVRCQNHGTAVNWRQRAYRFRRLWQEFTEEAYAGIPERINEVGTSPWDDMILRVDGLNVQITFERRDLVFVTPAGDVQSLGPVKPEPEPLVAGPLGLEEIETVAEGAFRSGPKLELD